MPKSITIFTQRTRLFEGNAPLLCLLLCVQHVWAATSAQSSVRSDLVLSDIGTILNRYTQSVIPTESSQVHHLEALAFQYSDSLEPNGSWSDLDYSDSPLPEWPATEHLQRTLVMAKSVRLHRYSGHPDLALERRVHLALDWWISHDYQDHLNRGLWWWNQIGVPELAGETAALLQPDLSNAELSGVVKILNRGDWRKGRWTGANLTWVAEIQIVRGCLDDDPDAVKESYDRLYGEIKIVGPTEEGIQQDYSFHQHGVQFYSGGYGLFYANDVGRFIAFAWGTRFQIPPDRMAIFSSFLLDGEQWMVRGDVFDYSTSGRVITRQGFVALPRDWTVGPISPAGPAYSLGNVIGMLAAEPIPRQQEFNAFARRLEEKPGAPELVGNKQFWNSDYMTHRRKGYMTSVKMLSNRIQNAELTNGEGKKSQHLSDGVNFLYLTGDEYKDIFPVWDWTKLPGTTAIQGTLQTGEKNPITTRGKTSFNGGVSDGTYGMAAMELSRGSLTADKAWFFFDDSYLCLGAGITLSGDAEHAVATDVNQTLLRGPVFRSRLSRPVGDGTLAYASSGAGWVFHNGVGYIFPRGTKLNLSVGAQTGRWSDIGAGIGLRAGDRKDRLVTERVFNLWIDHGKSPQGAAYQYVVLPGASAKETMARANHPQIDVLANDEKTQAAWNAKLKIAMIAFHAPGSLATPLGTVTADHPSLLVLKKLPSGYKITAANPENLPLALQLRIDSNEFAIDLPGGVMAGSSVTAPASSTAARLSRQNEWPTTLIR